ncbi:hypothetical protein B4100_3812 [Heyndrickxia coagulans]|nr:hypothetical protein B4100_3812 [Heyndrickxia coagulans]
MKQTVIRVRTTGDEWEGTQTTDRTALKCRVQEGAKLVRTSTTAANTTGIQASEVVSNAQIYLDKLADVALTDKFEYTNELGVTLTWAPITIEIKRDVGGKPMLTIVYV